MFCVVRFSSDERWLWAWWFADTTVHGKIVLERFCEYVASSVEPHGLHQFMVVRDCVVTDDSLDTSTIPMPDEVVAEASGKVHRGVHV